MLERHLIRELDAVGSRLVRWRLWIVLGVNWLVFAVAGGALLWAQQRQLALPLAVIAALGGAAVLSAAAAAVWARRIGSDYRQIARRIEARYPELDSLLLVAVQQHSEPKLSRLGFLQEQVVRQALLHGRHRPWSNVVSPARFQLVQIAHLAAAALLVIVLSALAVRAGGSGLHPAAGGDVALAGDQGADELTIEPGDAEIERGTSLLVLARFGGAVPHQATLVVRSEGGEQRIAMTRSLDDPLLVGRLAEVAADLTYHVEYAGTTSPTFQVRVFEYPRLQRLDAALVFPDYTRQAPATLEDTLRVTAVEGTEVTFLAHLNKPVASARLAAQGGGISVAFTPDAEDPRTMKAVMTLTESQRYRLQLTDDAGRANREPPEVVITVTPNRPPEIKLTWPARDTEVSPLEELELNATAADDFGLVGYGVTFLIGAGGSREVRLGESGPPRRPVQLRHVFDLEALGAEPDDLLSYFAWAEDAVGDGRIRRTVSDMFFAEVRPLEEIYRQAEQQPGGSQQQQQQQQQGGGGAEQAEQLAELQKQIIQATWNLIRRETADPPSSAYIEDTGAVMESQQSALGQATQLAGELADPRSQQFLDQAVEAMQTAEGELMKAIAGSSVAPLQPALAAEQAAYAALLKLRSHEHRVARGRQESSRGSQAASRSQRQLNQLELRDSENRYETQSTAAPPAEEGQRELRQAVNRLHELARRQQDLNEQLKQLQSALQEAESQAEREEIQRRLKRLREEQQQILRDTDELRERLDQSQRQPPMAEAGQQLQQTRENVRQASEALQEGRVSQAIASGERAGSEFRELRDQLRQQTSDRFRDEMRQMRGDAQQLQDNQEQLAQQLAEIDQSQPRSLRDGPQRQDISQQLQQQGGRLEDLLDRIQQTVQEAETAEPVLSRRLYDTYRRTRQQQVDRALDATRELLELGVLPEARQAEQQARAGIGELNRGVAQAAESVLGDETEALRQAGQRLQELSEQLEQEIAMADPAAEQSAGEQSGRQTGEQQGGRAGEPSDGRADEQSSGQPGERSDRQPGERSAGQPGERSNDQGGERSGEQLGESPEERSAGPAGERPEQQSAGGQRGEGSQPAGGEQPGGQSSEQQAAGGERSPGQPQPSGQQPSDQSGGDQPSGESGQRRGSPGGLRSGSATPAGGGGLEQLLGGTTGPGAPLTGDGFRDWSDTLRDVEEMLDDPQLRSEAAGIRDRAQAIRAEFKRHSQEPNWDLVREIIAQPLRHLSQQVAEELLRRQSRENLVPIDRDPIPPGFAEAVQRYYESLGSGQ